MKLIAVEGYTEVLSATGGWTITSYVVADPGIGSQVARAQGKAILKDEVQANINTITATHPTLGAFVQTPATPAFFALKSTIAFMRVEGAEPIAEGDSSDEVVVSGQITPPGGSPAPGSINAVLTVQVAGQTKVRAK